ncbi:MAG: methyltransferase domain-containing protein [Chloroflexota bacterium]|nr:methyltransferase domain-containing protein [Chloroflexota bacterium]
MLENNSQGNTYIFDPESGVEMARLLQLDRLLTRGAGGPLAGVPADAALHAVLDLACGPGGWVLDVAHECPDSQVTGIDISQSMIAYASTRATALKLHNATFYNMDLLRPLAFKDASFDMVNARLLVVVLQREAWSGMLDECFRITRPGGIVRLSEFDEFGLTTSQSYEVLKGLSAGILGKAGYGFSPDGRTHGITPKLSRLLQDAGFTNIQRNAYVVDFSAGTANWQTIFDHTIAICAEAKPFLLRSGVLSEQRFDELYQHMQVELLADDFCGILSYQSAVGTKPRA